MKILSWNILADSATDYLLREGISPQYLVREHRNPLNVDVLKNCDADVICLQEVEELEFELYRSALTNYTGEFLMFKRFGNAVFVRKGIDFRTEVHDFNTSAKRKAQIVKVGEMTIINMHLEWVRNCSRENW